MFGGDNRIRFKRKAAIAVMAVMVAFSFASSVLADSFSAEEAALNNEIAASRTQLNQLGAQEDTLKNKIAILNGQIDAVTYQLELSSIKLEKLNRDVADIEAQLQVQRDDLKSAVRTMQVDGDVSTFEMLVSSNNISDYLDKQQYITGIQDKIQDTMQKIGVLETSLKKQQADMVETTNTQKAQQQNLASTRAEQDQLLAETQNQESNYQSIVAANKQKLQSIYSERARLDALNHVSVATGGTGGYPFANYAPDSGSDPWGGLYRECVSYVNWKRRQVGIAPYPNFWGNAADWAYAAPTTSTPSVGAIAVFLPGVGGAGGVGHVAYVEGVNSNGTMNISEYNWTPYQYDYRSGVSTAGVRFIR